MPLHFSLSASVERLINLVDALQAQRVVLVGNSFGGVIAAAALAAQPERFAGVIFVDAAVYVDASMPSWLMNSPQMANIGPYFARALGYNEDFYRSMFADPTKITDTMRASAQRNTLADNWDAGLWQYLKNWNYDVDALQSGIEKIKQPALVITGREDAIVPAGESLRLAETLPNSEFKALDKCGHLPQLECPQAFQDAVNEWLANTF